MLKIYNTMTGRKEVFAPLVPKAVRMYVCGVTVYDESHLGHARSALVFETIRRYLKDCKFKVTFVKNFTDVDDKIINRAKELGIPWQTVTAKYVKTYYRDMKRLGIRRATVEPKATKHMADIIGLVRALIRKGVAYRVDGDVYFQVEKFPAYGALSKRKLEDMQAGARVEVDERKRNPMDFALWKASKPGEPEWPSAWGPGRPGWHIECSAMSMKHLGKTFDIHGGGMDLIFPHHENEIAQSCAATGKEFARYWVHNGFVEINKEKMSKSLGNFFTIREIFEEWNRRWRTKDANKRNRLTAEVLRYFLLSTHYRSPLAFSDVGLQEAKSALDGFYGLFRRLDERQTGSGKGDTHIGTLMDSFDRGFREAMDDDFNTPSAVAELQGLRSGVNKLLETGLSTKAKKQARQRFRVLGSVLGLFQLDSKRWEFAAITGTGALAAQATTVVGTGRVGDVKDKEIERLVAERSEARRRKDFKRADEIREFLKSHEIIIEDRPDGTSRWKR